MTLDLATIVFGLSSIFLLFLLLAQLRVWKKGISSFVLLFATTTTIVWSLCLFIQSGFNLNWTYLILLVEIVKNLSWFALLLSILGIRRLFFPVQGDELNRTGLALVSTVTLGIPLALLVYLLLVPFFRDFEIELLGFGGKTIIFAFLIIAISGLALLEQVIRNTRTHHQWHIKFLVLGLGILFSFDLYLYSEALLFDRMSIRLWSVRGAVIAIATPFLAIAVLRTRQQPIQLNISRRLVFHTSVLMSTGLYLLLMSFAGFYIRNFSVEWGALLQVLFWVCSLSLLLVLSVSGRLRSMLKVYISRNLFSSKYDYRDEWMRISQTLSQANSEESLPERVIHALANIVDSPAGGLWLTTNGIHFDQVAQVELNWYKDSSLNKDDFLIWYLLDTSRVIDLHKDKIDSRDLPVWLKQIPKAWLIVPLELNGKVLGFVLLKEARVNFTLNWEDYDLLKAAGQQSASYLAQMIASDALSEARQFSAFNQASAFVVHDIKTLNSQLSMLVSNAAKHKQNPDFIDDMIKTTEHAVKKMNFLLQHFKSEVKSSDDKLEVLNLVSLIIQVISTQSKLKPVPSLSCSESCINVLASSSELKSGIGHLIQNAQEATPDDGIVELTLSVKDELAILLIRDSGVGMEQEFIQTKLFRPFESTKGLAGMGIGVYQCRDYIRNLGGDLVANSEPGVGSEFTLSIPITKA